MALAVGSRLGVFEVTGALGAGGMGEVYRARDTSLKRDVALKILPAALAADPDRVARFQREAELLATLAHPHIAAIHGLVEVDGVRALVLELAAGETLAERVARGPLPIGEVVALARQLADALDYAHEHGVVHRDLKPANLKVTPDGALKVLDFGLAKALEGPHPFSAEAAHSPTLTSPAMTQAGMLLGTAAYMSPEQVRGKPVDKRADIWAFGAVLYELLTGDRAFEGETVSDTLAAVLRSEPDWARLPATTPPYLLALLRHSLTRDPRERLRDIGDALRALTDGGQTATQAPSSEPKRRPRSLWPSWTVAAVLGAALVGVVLQWAPWRATAPAPVQRLSIDLGVDATLNANRGTAAVLSPDGQTLAFAAVPRNGTRSSLYVRRLDQLTATLIPGTDDARGPFFSPDGAWIAFFADDKLKKVETRGGTVAVIGDAPNARGGDWMEDGRIVLLPVIGGGSALHQVPVTGGRLSPFIESDPSASQRWPQVLPGGGAVLYTRVQPGVPSAVVVQPLPAGERRTLLTGDYGRYVPSGHLLHVQDGALFATPFDASALELKGATTRIADGIAVTAAENAQIHASASGALVYQAGAATEVGAPLDWLSASGEVTALSAEAVDWVAPKFSPDGRHLAYNVPGGGLWTYDLARGVRSPVTATTRGAGVSAAWTPDGSRLVFSAAEADQPPNLYWRRSDGSGPVQRLGESPYQQSQPTWHPNGRVLAFQQATPPANDIMILEVEGSEAAGWKPGQASQFTDGPSIDIDPAFSADGRWLAFSSNESGRYEVHVRPFPGPGGRVVVSTGGGRYPQWSRTTNQLVFVERNDVPARLMVVNYRAENGAFVPDAPRPWANARIMPRRSNLNYTLHPDGTRVVTHVERPSDQVAGGGDRLVYVTNFSAELRRLAPPTR